MTKDELAKISMMIITHAGVAKSLAFEAITEFKVGNNEIAKKHIIEAEENLKLASQEHFKCLIIDAKSSITIDILYVHAEDQLISAETVINFAKILF